jgi:signal transduction histidine kinase
MLCAPKGSGAEVKRLSLTWRIILGVVVCQLLLTAGLVAVAVRTARREMYAAFGAGLHGRAMSALALVRYTESEPHALYFDAARLPPSGRSAQRDLYEVRNADGSLLARSANWEGPSSAQSIELTVRGQTYLDFRDGGTPYRAIVLRDAVILDEEEGIPPPLPKVTIVYAAPVVEIEHRLTELGLTIAGASAGLLVLASLLAAWSVRKGLLPLRELAAQAENVSVRNWAFQAPPAANETSELAPLTRAIESVLARLHDAFRQQRDFTSNAAHELKTSVAIVKSTLQVLLQRPRPEQEYRAGLEKLLEDCARLEDLLQRMLRLARIEQWVETDDGRERAVTELVSTCETAVARIGAVAAGRGVTIDVQSAAPIPIRADPEDLESIWVNLLENAVQYSPTGSRVQMQIENGVGRAARISVLDSGPGIPPEQLPHIFERFHRGDPSRARETGGFGLGLAIAKAITEAYGGTIAASNRAEGGARFVVELPRTDE